MCTSFLRSVAMANTQVLANTEIRIPIPFFYNLPLGPISNIPGSFFNVSECHEWYMYQYSPNST